MAILGLLCVLFLQALHASAETVRGCASKEPEDRDTPVESCDFYCGKNDLDQWLMGYYVNGTKCKYTDSQNGYCVEVPDNEGCHPDNSQYVLDFVGHTSGADTIPPTPTTSKPANTKEQKRRKKPNSKKKTKKTNETETAKPKGDKKPKKTKKQKDKKKQKDSKKKKSKTHETKSSYVW
uniref:Putative basic tail protein n=1 Tax=Amblyomma cajennense TaxID=34607 RepID=A0A023FTJ6_AMBCJ